MADFRELTKQYKLSKTLRFELKPIGKTAHWIKKHNIIGIDENRNLMGKDAERAKNYKFIKKVFDAMHRLFIEDCLASMNGGNSTVDSENGNIDPNKADRIMLGKLVIEIYEEMTESTKRSTVIEEYRKRLSDLFSGIFNRIAGQWIAEYTNQMPTFWQKDLDDIQTKINTTTNNQKKKSLKKALGNIQKKKDKIKFNKKGYAALTNNSDAFQLLEWLVRMGCRFWLKSATHSGINLPLIPA